MSCSLTGVLSADNTNVICTATSGTFNTSQVATANQVTATVTISGKRSGQLYARCAGNNTELDGGYGLGANYGPVHNGQGH